MFRIVTLATQKGGAGKTTLATSLAVAARQAGETVVLLDFDFLQKSAVAWFDIRTSPKGDENPRPVADPTRPIVQAFPADKVANVKPLLNSLAGKGATLVLLDTPGADNPAVNAALAASHFAVVVLAPTRIDLLAVKPTVKALMRAEVEFGFALNNCPTTPNNPRAERMATGLTTVGPVAPVYIGRRADFQDAFADGKGVTEYAPGSIAAQEVQKLWQWIDEQTKEKARGTTANTLSL